MRKFRTRFGLPVVLVFVALVGVAGAARMFRSYRPGPGDGTIRMAARLASIARTTRLESGFNNQDAIQELKYALTQSLPDNQQSLIRQALAHQYRLVGRNDEAIEEYRTALELLDGLPGPGPREACGKIHGELGMCYLRVAEQENCIAENNCSSCLFPILADSSGVHRKQRGARMAVDEWLAALAADPSDLAAKWLLNVTFMTLGEYPDGVPSEWLIPESVFASDISFPRFYDVATHLGVDSLGLAGGVIVEDFDCDGYLDIMVSSVGLTDQLRLFHNNGNGSFSDWTERAGLTGIVGGLNLSHADYNNDGYPDALVLRGGWQKAEGRQPNSLLRNNGNGTFEDVTERAGMLSFRPRQTGAWADFDGDGWLDLFVGNEPGPPNQFPCELFHNNQDGTFTECAMRLGVAVTGVCKAAVWGDYNNDGRPDLFISRNGQPNILFRNDGPAPELANASPAEKKRREGAAWWRFTDVSESAGVTKPIWSFPCWFWDYDNDGWEDLLVFGYDQREPQLKHIAADYLGLPTEGPKPILYHNKRDGTFEDVTVAVGLDKVLLAMGANFGDLDNDGYPDFYVGTGDPDFRTLIPNRMFHNEGGRRFQDVTTAGGFGHLQKGHGIAFADLDNDGDQDIYADLGGFAVADQAHNALFENPGFGNHWITLRLEGKKSNRSAIGARIRIDVDTPEGPREFYGAVRTGGSFGSSSLQQEMGLGDATKLRRLSITWPTTGTTDVYENLPLDVIVRIRESNSKPTIVPAKPLSFSPTRGREPPPWSCCEPK
jgi:hypothetical protein